MISKTDLRKHFIEKRKVLNTELLSGLICQNIIKCAVFKNAKNIFAYYPLPFEVDICQLFEDKSKNWFLPKIKGDELKFFEYRIEDKLCKGTFNVFEPYEKPETKVIPDLIIVPALCFDKNNYRLGYGKGFYDKFLKTFPKKNRPTTVSPIFSALKTDFLPAENHDEKINIIITENDILYGENYAEN